MVECKKRILTGIRPTGPLQVANILLLRAHLVPVGEDQLPHIELTREMARRFNRQFKDVFPEPDGLVGRAPRLVGVKGQANVTTSLNNAIYLKDTPAAVNEKVPSPPPLYQYSIKS